MDRYFRTAIRYASNCRDYSLSFYLIQHLIKRGSNLLQVTKRGSVLNHIIHQYSVPNSSSSEIARYIIVKSLDLHSLYPLGNHNIKSEWKFDFVKYILQKPPILSISDHDYEMFFDFKA